MDDLNLFAIKQSVFYRSGVEANHADVHHRTGKNPVAVTHGEENVSRVFDSLQNFTVCTATNALRCEQTSAVALDPFDLLARLFKPVATQIRGPWHAVFISSPKLLLVMPA